ncbi:MAG: hypothetical protein IPG70_07075 [Moraxellaceae bacterium]|nr:hypothetical protein [Moraxellaceae bacterium]
MMCSAPTQQGTNRLLVSDDRQGIDPNVEQNPLSSHELACLLGRFYVLMLQPIGHWPPNFGVNVMSSYLNASNNMIHANRHRLGAFCNNSYNKPKHAT